MALDIVHLVPKVGPRAFGLAPPPLSLTAGLQRAGHHCEVWCVDETEETSRATEKQYGLVPGCVKSFRGFGPERLAYSPSLVSALLSRPDTHLVHQHGIWTGLSYAARKWRRHTGRPCVLAAHGSLDQWALRKSRLKKRVALTLIELDNLRHASCLHAVSLREVQNYRDFGLVNPIALIPNGVDARQCAPGDRRVARLAMGLDEEDVLLLFLGRVTPKKGLANLLRAMSSLGPGVPRSRLLVVGPDEENHGAYLRSLVGALGLDTRVVFAGPLYGERKNEALAGADIFVLPSVSEGAPIAVLEALAAGLPVFCTPETSWERVADEGCGWCVSSDVKGLSVGLARALSCGRQERLRAGESARNLITTHFLWDSITLHAETLYEWLLHGGSPPSVVSVHGAS